MIFFKSKKTLILSCLTLVLTATFIWYKRSHSHSPLVADRVMVDVGEVQQGNIPIQAHEIGTLTAAKHIEITTEIAGQVAKIFFHDGDFVLQGTPLIQLDDTVYQTKLKSAEAVLLYSKSDYKRKLFLGKQGAIAQQAIDQALADYKEKKAIVEESRVLLNKMKLTAPFDGVLGKVKVSPGEYVTAGQKIVPLTDIKNLYVEYAVPERYLSQLHLGQEVTITTSAYPEKTFHGKLTFISPTINVSDRTISLYAEIPNEKSLLTAGLFVNITHNVGIENHALLVPASSLVSAIDGQQVFKVINDKVTSVPVMIGQRIEDKVQIISGLQKGDHIVLSGQQQLKEGALIQANSREKI